MPLFTIERTFNVPHFRHATYDAPDLAAALAMDEENDDWQDQKEDFDTSGDEHVTGAWAGDTDYVGENLAPRLTEDEAAALLREAVVDWEEFDSNRDDDVNGGDLVEWFAEWRARVKAALPA